MPTPLEPLLAFAHELADLARPIARHHFRRGATGYRQKADLTPVTEADREIERAMRDHIEQHHPEHGVLGEEHGRARLDAEFVWVLDPIDGTKAFATGNPLFGTLIGLWHGGRPVLGVLDAPALGERYHAAEGLGAFRGEQRLQLATPPRELSQAVLHCTTPDLLLEHEGHRELRRRVRWTGYGADCIAYALLAAGGPSLIVDTTLQPYDWCALAPIVREAGGHVCDWRGEAPALEGGGDLIAAASVELAQAACALLAAG